jgi:hypothetical protein
MRLDEMAMGKLQVIKGGSHSLLVPLARFLYI